MPPGAEAPPEPVIGVQDAGGCAGATGAGPVGVAEGAAVVLVTHDLDYARTAAHRLVALDGGRLAEC